MDPAPFLDGQGVYAPHLYTFSFDADTTPLETLTMDDLRPNMACGGAGEHLVELQPG